MFIDKTTGQESAPVPLRNPGSAKFTGEALFLPHRVVLGTETQVIRLMMQGIRQN